MDRARPWDVTELQLKQPNLGQINPRFFAESLQLSNFLTFSALNLHIRALGSNTVLEGFPVDLYHSAR